jgi:hypothetical protein
MKNSGHVARPAKSTGKPALVDVEVDLATLYALRVATREYVRVILRQERLPDTRMFQTVKAILDREQALEDTYLAAREKRG